MGESQAAGRVRGIGARGGLAIALIAIVGVVVALLVFFQSPDPQSQQGVAQREAASAAAMAAGLPSQPIPEVPPLELVPLTPTDAKAANAALPMVSGPLQAASPFIFTGSAEDRAAALGCLTGALLYEAGDDAVGQRAVAQVILNRMRHPAFPSSVCGVVFQGSERKTGCQFTFTCDGALNRVPNPAAIARARVIAGAALEGSVAANVGLATHYHTDWVYPYWASSLDKIARVDTHLFYRWKGGWGARKAFVQGYTGGEVVGAKLARWVGANGTPTEVALLAAVPSELTTADSGRVTGGAAPALDIPASQLKGAVVAAVDADRGIFVLRLEPGAFAGDYAMTALNLCSKRNECSVVGYLPAGELPKTLPLTPKDIQRAAFYYHANKGSSPDTTLWNCQQIARKDQSQCLPGTR